MIEVASLLVVLLMSLIVTRVATVALTLTGITHGTARFQARSALTGAGFTTSESERVVSHPVRRRVIMLLMLLGNTGLVLAASLMVLLFSGDGGGGRRWPALVVLLVGLAGLYLFASSRWVERGMGRFIERLLARHTDLPGRDYASLLHLGNEYRVVELQVRDHDWLGGRALSELALTEEGVLTLGITRADGRYVGAPRGATRIEPGDTLMLYGRAAVIRDLDERRAGPGGQIRHAESIARERQVQAHEAQEEARAGLRSDADEAARGARVAAGRRDPRPARDPADATDPTGDTAGGDSPDRRPTRRS